MKKSFKLINQLVKEAGFNGYCTTADEEGFSSCGKDIMGFRVHVKFDESYGTSVLAFTREGSEVTSDSIENAIGSFNQPCANMGAVLKNIFGFVNMVDGIILKNK